MKKERLSVEEVNAFKPSFENPMRVVCDDNHYSQELEKVAIISPIVSGECACINSNGNISILYSTRFHHYASLKPERKLRELWCWHYLAQFNDKIFSTYADDFFVMLDGSISHVLNNSKWKRKIESSRILWDDDKKEVVDE